MNEKTDHQTQSLEERLARAEAELQSFAFIASHDLQEPLRKIASFGSRLRDMNVDKLDERSLDYLDRMLNATDRMKEMLQGLLAFSRITTRGKPFQSLELQTVVKNAAGLFDDRLRNLQGHIAIDSLPGLEGDAEQLQQLFECLFDNAIKFSHEGVPPIVAVTGQPVADAPEFIRIYIKDNGIGFALDKQEQIFELFHKLHGRQYPGPGMGLAIARRIADRHGGSLTVQSQPCIGSTFILTLPKAQA